MGTRTILALSLALAGCAERTGVDRAAGAPDVALISIDTLRADSLSCYGNPRPLTPTLDALAARGVRFAQAFSQAPNTATSHASLFTGLPPWGHRVANISSLEHGTPALHPAFTTLAEHFNAAGYATAAVTDDGPLGQGWDLLQGFESVDARYTPIDETVRSALDVLANREPDRPLFLFVHTYEVHEPYLPPPALVERFGRGYDGPLLAALDEVRAEQLEDDAQPNGRRMLRDQADFDDRDVRFLRDLYEAGVAHADARLSPLLRALGDDALVAVTSDHGEEFGEHGVFGHKQLYQETLHVPLILALPGGELAGTVVDRPVSLIDLHGTLLAAAGLRPSPGANSADLRAVASGASVSIEDPIASTNEHLHPATATLPLLRSIRTRRGTWLDARDDGGRGPLIGELYATEDRGESTPIHFGPLEQVRDGERKLVEMATQQLDARFASADRYFRELLANSPPAPTTRDSRGAVEALRRLGYLEEE